MSAFANISGLRFGRLVATSRDGTARNGAALWRCSCDCGGSVTVQAASLRAGRTRSCGCLKEEYRTTPTREARRHGHARKSGLSKTYNSWTSMKKRCRDPNNKDWKIYGGRGITYCERWERFENFIADMGARPEGTSLDRFPDKNGNYEPDNCRWATDLEQARNRRPPTRRALTC